MSYYRLTQEYLKVQVTLDKSICQMKGGKVPSAGCQAVRSSKVCDWRTALLPSNTMNIVSTNRHSAQIAYACIISSEFIPVYTVTGGSFLSGWSNTDEQLKIDILRLSLSMKMIAPSWPCLLSLSTFVDEEVWLRFFCFYI